MHSNQDKMWNNNKICKKKCPNYVAKPKKFDTGNELMVSNNKLCKKNHHRT